MEEISSRNGKKKNIVYRIFGQIPARIVLYMLSWSGFIVSFMLRTNINVAIIAMVKEPKITHFNNTVDERRCPNQQQVVNEKLQIQYGGTLDWSAEVQSYVLASFSGAYLVSQLIGGWATRKIGTKRMFGYAQLITALCSLCIPWASEVHYILVIVLNNIQGLASGVTWPAMFDLIGRWIPVNERSRFISSFQGFSIGTGVTYPLCGLLIAHLGWRSVFYTTGSIGLLWCLLWYLLAFDSPETHPRISLAEKQYIKANTINTSRPQTVPWVKILTSKPVWAITITTFGRIWIFFLFVIMGPRFMQTMLGFSIQKSGLLSGGPFITCYFAALAFCYTADKLIIKNWMSLTNVRKLFTGLSQILPGILVLLITHLECNVELILAVWFIAISMMSASFAGSLPNIVDIAPNLSAPVLAFSQTVSMTAAFLSPLAAGYLTKDGHTLAAWRNVFNISAILTISTYIVYLLFGTGEIQSWNETEATVNSTEQDIILEDTNNQLDKL